MDRKRLAAIHIIKKELGLSEAEYRRILKREAGVKSSKDLDEAGFHKLMHYFVRSRRYRVFPGGLTLRQKLFLQYLARSMEWDMEHLQHFIQKYYHKTGIDALT